MADLKLSQDGDLLRTAIELPLLELEDVVLELEEELELPEEVEVELLEELELSEELELLEEDTLLLLLSPILPSVTILKISLLISR